ncbi:uncharacterized protein V1518DRAFT_419159 [Limtongia smithiae]|uniref:uncharacterized protein n=1 Tax=Limtongia smithiae TaxID=1125753 RepID=UPI0034CE6E90
MASHLVPFYVYSLPEALVPTLEPLTFDTAVAPDPSRLTSSSEQQLTFEEDTTSEVSTDDTKCSVCSIALPITVERRIHYKSDLHKFNLKRKIRGLAVVDQNEFSKLIDDDDSLSGSDSASSETSDIDYVTDLIGGTMLEMIPESDDDEQVPKHSPFYTFSSKLLPPESVLAIYSCLFSPLADNAAPLDMVKSQQLTPTGKQGQVQHSESTPISAIFLLGGGHFAGSIISHAINSQNRGDLVVLVAHKTFHRYTTRRKQGGAQSTSDNAHGKAHSAGSNLRRYNEAMLEKEVRELLVEWKPYLDCAVNIFIRANGRQNRSILVGYNDAVIDKKDARVKTIPFSTRRATGSEVKRVWLELTRPKIMNVNLFIPVQSKSKSKPKRVAIAENTSPEPEISENELHTSQIVAFVKKSRTNPLAAYLTANDLSPNFRLEPFAQYYHTPTALHLASSLSQARMVQFIMTTLHADPTCRNDGGRTAYDLAGDRATRDAFRLARGDLETMDPIAVNWKKSNIPAALSKSDIAARDAAENADAARERAEALRQFEEQQQKQKTLRGGGKKLASSVITATGPSSQQMLAGLTPEARMKIERERRARAVEARMKLQGKS